MQHQAQQIAYDKFGNPIKEGKEPKFGGYAPAQPTSEQAVINKNSGDIQLEQQQQIQRGSADIPDYAQFQYGPPPKDNAMKRTGHKIEGFMEKTANVMKRRTKVPCVYCLAEQNVKKNALGHFRCYNCLAINGAPELQHPQPQVIFGRATCGHCAGVFTYRAQESSYPICHLCKKSNFLPLEQQPKQLPGALDLNDKLRRKDHLRREEELLHKEQGMVRKDYGHFLRDDPPITQYPLQQQPGSVIHQPGIMQPGVIHQQPIIHKEPHLHHGTQFQQDPLIPQQQGVYQQSNIIPGQQGYQDQQYYDQQHGSSITDKAKAALGMKAAQHVMQGQQGQQVQPGTQYQQGYTDQQHGSSITDKAKAAIGMKVAQHEMQGQQGQQIQPGMQQFVGQQVQPGTQYQQGYTDQQQGSSIIDKGKAALGMKVAQHEHKKHREGREGSSSSSDRERKGKSSLADKAKAAIGLGITKHELTKNRKEGSSSSSGKRRDKPSLIDKGKAALGMKVAQHEMQGQQGQQIQPGMQYQHGQQLQPGMQYQHGQQLQPGMQYQGGQSVQPGMQQFVGQQVQPGTQYQQGYTDQQQNPSLIDKAKATIGMKTAQHEQRREGREGSSSSSDRERKGKSSLGDKAKVAIGLGIAKHELTKHRKPGSSSSSSSSGKRRDKPSLGEKAKAAIGIHMAKKAWSKPAKEDRSSSSGKRRDKPSLMDKGKAFLGMKKAEHQQQGSNIQPETQYQQGYTDQQYKPTLLDKGKHLLGLDKGVMGGEKAQMAGQQHHVREPIFGGEQHRIGDPNILQQGQQFQGQQYYEQQNIPFQQQQQFIPGQENFQQVPGVQIIQQPNVYEQTKLNENIQHAEALLQNQPSKIEKTVITVTKDVLPQQ